MVRPLLLLPAVLIFGLAALPALSPSQEGSTAQKPAKPGEIPAHVKEIYKIDCALCHGETGDGKTDLAKDMSLTMADWTDAKTLDGKTDQQLFDIIRKGKDKMPPEDASRAKDADVKGLILYIRNLSKAQPAPAQAPATTPEPAPAPASSPGTN